jgi:outer membrane protein TolC
MRETLRLTALLTASALIAAPAPAQPATAKAAERVAKVEPPPVLTRVPFVSAPAPARPPVAYDDLPQAPSAVVRPLVLTGGVVVQQEQPGAVPLTLDQAIQIAIKNNTSIKISQEQERYVQGEILTVENALVPGLTASGYQRAQEINLAAMGFKPGVISIPGIDLSHLKEIVKVDTTSAQITLSQQLFNLPAFELFRAARKAGDAANWATLNVRGGVVLNAGALYLKVLADRATIRNAQALLQQDQVVFDHAKASRDAGVGINLDVLRAQVQLQSDKQQLISAINGEAKDKIQLNRVMGQPAGQELELVDAIPYADFDASQSDDALRDALAIAYVKRKDLRGLEAQLEVAQKTRDALKYERLPVLGFGGYYGVLGETHGLYHGNFVAEGQLSVPVFYEAALRGQKEVSAAQIRQLQQQIDAVKAQIEADIRSSLFDVQSAQAQVKIAHSNVDLATQALSDATERFTSGVDDNLAVVRAQAALEGAQAQVVQTEFEYNYAKLVLARNTGVVESEYRTYLGR